MRAEGIDSSGKATAAAGVNLNSNECLQRDPSKIYLSAFYPSLRIHLQLMVGKEEEGIFFHGIATGKVPIFLSIASPLLKVM